MKKTIALLLLALGVAGCNTNARIIHDLSLSTAAVRVRLISPQGTLEYDRANPGTNTITVSKDGITTK